jgi:Cu-Zn family superoxide dismutase
MKAFPIVAFVLFLAGCASMQTGSPRATAELKNAKGDVIGTANLWEDASGVRVVTQVRGLSPGRHGFHIHAVGKCDPPEFTTAGGHFNPGGKKHGLKNPAGPHAGDLPNLEVGADGTGRQEQVTKLVTLGSGPTSLFDADGSALVVHANPDDDVTDPTGNSGGRVACGVVRRASGY